MSISFVTHFLELVQISLQTSFVIGIILIVRWVFQKIHVPESKKCFLWLIPMIRLLIPFHMESMFSILPKFLIEHRIDQMEVTNPEVIFSHGLKMDIRNFTEAVLENGLNSLKEVIQFTASVIWIAGIIVLLLYGVILAHKIKKQIEFSMNLENNIYLSDSISSVIIFGFKNPVIYVPSNLSDEMLDYIILHEQIHIKRKDHIVRMFLYLLCTIFWFQPAMWIFYYFSLKDMELACDEAVLKQLGINKNKNYAKALLEMSMYMKEDKNVPFVFMERNPQKRIQKIMSCKERGNCFRFIWQIMMMICGVSLLTNPSTKEATHMAAKEIDITPIYGLAEDEPVTVLDSSGDGNRKTSYLIFGLEERAIITLSMEQICDMKTLEIEEIQKTKLHIQKKESGVWIRVAESYSWYENEKELVYGLSKGEYRFVLESGYPKTIIHFHKEEYGDPAFQREEAVRLTEEGLIQTARGMISVEDNKSQWYHFSVPEGTMNLYLKCYYGEASTEASLYLYDEKGDKLDEINWWYDCGEEQEYGSFEKGDYYIEIIPREIKAGTYFEISLKTYEKTK